MPYLISTLAVAAGAVVLVTLLVWLAGQARRLAGTVRASRARLADRWGRLSARTAALRVELAQQRRRRGSAGGSAGLPAA